MYGLAVIEVMTMSGHLSNTNEIKGKIKELSTSMMKDSYL